ncbi:hypothetical protein [Nonomuraea sp. NPDC046570]|uniref:hypothetical protein n=1 Tax=Nonomuraea sp. NPDC046570 TaxID=3155255 RepID=UPI0033C5A8B1
MIQLVSPGPLARRYGCRLGADVEVISPAELRERLAETAETLAVVYRSGTPSQLP